MSIIIKNFNKFSAKNYNLVVFLSKLSQLKRLNLPFNLQKQLNNNDFIHRITINKFAELTKEHDSGNFLINIKFFLVDLDTDQPALYGANLHNKFDYNVDKEISIIFSNDLMRNHTNFISDILFGYFMRSYEFRKYLNKEKLFPNNIFVYSMNSKLIKLVHYKSNLLRSINFCKDLISEPANTLNPIAYSEKCKSLRKYGLTIKILDQHQLSKIGMNSLLGVAKGSANKPRVVILEWNLSKNIKPTILVGKGVTFDTGGISLKPSNGMEEMIMDMGGSAVVVGSMMNAALNNSKHSILGIIGLVENMPDGESQRPGDIIESLSGQTIEVLNTDAEGRLILADILTYVQKKYKPKQIIDFATLTGAILVALGTHRAGLFSNNDKLSEKLFKAGNISGEKIWRLPLGVEYDDEINSLRADMKNIGSTRYGGSIQAAQFLKRFIENDTPWAHLDIAGVTWNAKSSKNSFSNLHSPGATGFGVRLIDSFLKGS